MVERIDWLLETLRTLNKEIAWHNRDIERAVNQRTKILLELRDNEIRNTQDLRSYLEHKGAELNHAV